jgi:hypothetical protein
MSCIGLACWYCCGPRNATSWPICPQQRRAHAFLYGYDPGIGCRVFAAGALWWLGYPEQALQQSDEVLTLACELSHLFYLAFYQHVADDSRAKVD